MKNANPFTVGPHGVRYASQWRTVTDKAGITWSFNGYNSATNAALFASVGFANVATRHIDLNDTQALTSGPNAFDCAGLCRMFGWQGGTIFQVIDALRLGEPARACA